MEMKVNAVMQKTYKIRLYKTAKKEKAEHEKLKRNQEKKIVLDLPL